METKLSALNAKKLKALGINAKDEESARVKLLEILTKNDIDGMEDEDTDTLIEIVESFTDDEVVEIPEKEKAKNDNDSLAKEVEEEVKEVEEEEEEEEEEEIVDDFSKMTRTELKAFIKSNTLSVRVKKSMTDDAIRDAIRDVLKVVEEPKVVETKATKEPKKKATKKSKKKVVEDPTAQAKSDAKVAKKKIKKCGIKLHPQSVEEDRLAFEPLKKLFPEDKFKYAWVVSSGVTIKYKGKNSLRGLVLVENCSLQADKSVKCNLYLLTFAKTTDILDKLGIEYQICWTGAPMMKGITLDEAIEIIKSVMEYLTAFVEKLDKKLGENRKKMEDNLKK